jgi:hypothetical protein
MPKSKCSVATCESPTRARGLCNRHYHRSRAKRTGFVLKPEHDPDPLTQEEQARERWASVPAFEGYYEVSDLGRVRGLDRVSTTNNGRRLELRGKIRRQTPTRKGYLSVGLRRDGYRRQCEVHGLVLRAFVGDRPEDLQCRHLDGNRRNNRLSNLCWGTYAENQADIDRHGTRHKPDCRRGHPLALSNLMPGPAARGKRTCLACNRGRVLAAKIGSQSEVSVIADLYYAEIADADVSTRKRADNAIVQFFADDIARALRALERHRSNAKGKCPGCSTQSRAVAWPCRIAALAAAACDQVSRRPAPEPPARAANAACETASHRPVPKPFTADRPFLAAIEANSTSQTMPMRAVSRTVSRTAHR